MSSDITNKSVEPKDFDALLLELDRLAEELGGLMKVEPPKGWVPGRARGGAVLHTETSRSPDVQKRAYEQRQAELSGRINAIDALLAQKKFGDPLPDALNDPVNRYGQAKTDAAAAASRGDYTTATRELGKVDESAAALEAYVPHIQAFDDVRALIATIDNELVTEGYVAHPAK